MKITHNREHRCGWIPLKSGPFKGIFQPEHADKSDDLLSAVISWPNEEMCELRPSKIHSLPASQPIVAFNLSLHALLSFIQRNVQRTKTIGRVASVLHAVSSISSIVDHHVRTVPRERRWDENIRRLFRSHYVKCATKRAKGKSVRVTTAE